MAYGTVKIKEVLYLMDKELGTAWRSGSAAEIIATIEAFATAIELTTSLSATNLIATDAAPGTQTASTIVLGQKDSTTGSKAVIDLEMEDDVEVVGTFTPSHKFSIWINGTEYKMQCQAVV